MDNLTHSLFGVMLSKAGLDRYTPHATSLCVIAANAPDIDIVSGLDPAAYLIWHRHFTHGFAVVPLMAAFAVALTWGLAKLIARARGRPWDAPPFRRAFLVALIPAASHPLLDWTNSYGLRPWLPFSGEWSSLDLLFIIDFWVWGILLAGTIAAALIKRRVVAGAALAVFAGYLAMSAHWHGQALAAVRQADGAQPANTAAWPAPWSPFLWVGWAEVDGKDLWVQIDLRNPDLSAAATFDRPARTPALDAAWGSKLGRAYAQFTRFPLVEATATEVTLSDYRFFRFGRIGFACRFSLDESGRVVNERFEF